MNVSGIEIKKNCKNLLGIKIDCGVKFKNLLDRVIEKTIDKLNALSRVTLFMSYCPLVWMFRSSIVNNNINHLHERCLRVLYKGKTSSFKELLEKDGSVPTHNRNLQILAIEMLKVYGVALSTFTEIFNLRNLNYKRRYKSHFSIPHVSVYVY